MRKKKNCDARMERCSDIWIKEPEKYKGKWAERFGNDNPIHIEIGCGKGNFIVGMAKMYPDVNFIAIEKVEDVIVMAMEKTVAAELTNVLFMDMDAEKIEDIFEFGEIRRIYLNFSDPWKKNKQAKRRLTHKRFLDRYKAVLKQGDYIWFKTDNKALFDFSLNSFDSETRFALCEPGFSFSSSRFGLNTWSALCDVTGRATFSECFYNIYLKEYIDTQSTL